MSSLKKQVTVCAKHPCAKCKKTLHVTTRALCYDCDAKTIGLTAINEYAKTLVAQKRKEQQSKVCAGFGCFERFHPKDSGDDTYCAKCVAKSTMCSSTGCKGRRVNDYCRECVTFRPASSSTSAGSPATDKPLCKPAECSTWHT